MAARRPGASDVAIAAVYAGVFIGPTVLALGPAVLSLPLFAGGGPLSVSVELRVGLGSLGSIALVLACAAALAWRRIRPKASYLAICAVGLAQVVTGEPFAAWNVAMGISLFSVAAHGDRGFARLALVIAAVGYLGIWVLDADLVDRLSSLSSMLDLLNSGRTVGFAAGFAVLLVVWVVGDQLRASRERDEARIERVAQQERERQANARFDAMAERHRIARELHDVVAHGLSVMIVQADGALYAEAEHPEAPRQALATIAATGRESLAEMRHLLGVLRDDPDAAQLAPQPGLAAIPTLIERFRDAGLSVSYLEDGTPRAVQPGVGLTAYRVVQESLTNVLHHVGPTRVEVRVTFLPFGLGLVVTNEPGQRPVAPSLDERRGLGLLGMRERVGLLGGKMVAGPNASGGFTVEVEIPDGTRPTTGTPA